MKNKVELHELGGKERLCGEAWSVPVMPQVMLRVNLVKLLTEGICTICLRNEVPREMKGGVETQRARSLNVACHR